MELLDDIQAQGPRGRPRRRPVSFHGDRAYGTPKNIAGTLKRRVVSLLARPTQPHGSGLGKFRYVVERTLSWFGQNRRLKICYEKMGEHFQALHDLAAAIICARRLAHAQT
jgi:transposase